ncbi:MAG TPA: hypothetical protein IAC96_11545 [Candidatus Fimimorpha faecalis]|uniref:Uncharacterized protein n=1 Tax=Candidatus Fimimorpha faecalis TaxID=2840824 RepID=A0A9D1EG68_9FIRM|nr:hypothetical protein [Candidatus Fimimorpha faecalis]
MLAIIIGIFIGGCIGALLFDIMGVSEDAITVYHAIFLIVINIIGGVIGGIINSKIKKRKREELERSHEIERREQELKRRKIEWQNQFIDWDNRLVKCYQIIENSIGSGVEEESLYSPIWRLEKEMMNAEMREQYIKRFDERLSYHQEWIKNYITGNMYGNYAIKCVLDALKCLKASYRQDNKFNSAIDGLKKFIHSLEETTNYISFDMYGDCNFPLDDSKEMEYMDIHALEIEHRLQTSINNVNDNTDGYYIGIVKNLTPEFIEISCKLMWYYAKKKPFNVTKFDSARNIYGIYTTKYFTNSKNKNGELIGFVKVEEILARIYAKNQMGGIETVRQEMDYVNLWLRKNISLKNEAECYIFASGLAWMELYELEREILKNLVKFNVQLPADLQERLSFLENGGTSNVKIYEIEPTGEFLYDTSSIDWKAAEYEVFFRKLSMKNMQLKYSLAIQKWKKTIPLSKGQKVDQDKIYSQFVDMIEDFDGEVTCEKVTAKAINRVNEENENAILFQFNSKKNRCVSILFSSEKYGRNLNLMIITLFTPEKELNNDELKKCAMSIKDSIYVDSFKESILQEIDLVLREKKSIYDCDEEESVSAKKVFE